MRNFNHCLVDHDRRRIQGADAGFQIQALRFERDRSAVRERGVKPRQGVGGEQFRRMRMLHVIATCPDPALSDFRTRFGKGARVSPVLPLHQPLDETEQAQAAKRLRLRH